MSYVDPRAPRVFVCAEEYEITTEAWTEVDCAVDSISRLSFLQMPQKNI